MILKRVLRPGDGQRVHREFHREQGKIFPERFLTLQRDPFIQKTDLVMAVQDPRVRSRVQRDLQALDIRPEMVDPVSRAAQYPDLLPVQPDTEPQRDLRI